MEQLTPDARPGTLVSLARTHNSPARYTGTTRPCCPSCGVPMFEVIDMTGDRRTVRNAWIIDQAPGFAPSILDDDYRPPMSAWQGW